MPISTAVSPSAVAKVLGIKTEYKNLAGGRARILPQRIAVLAQGADAVTYSLTKRQVFSAQEAGEVYGFGSPIHLIVNQLLPPTGDGVGSIPVTVYPLGQGTDPTPAALAPVGVPTAVATYQIKVNNILSEPVTVAVSQSVASMCTAIAAAINAVPNMPVIATASATDVDMAPKWGGGTGIEIYAEVVGPTDAGTTFTFTAASGSLTDPVIDTALAQMGNVWETMLVLGVSGGIAYDAAMAVGEARWGALLRKPFIAFHGDSTTSPSTASTTPHSRTTDRINSKLVAPGSKDFSFVIAARQVARIAAMADANPAHDYIGLRATGLTPGTDGDQWDYAERDYAVKRGCSTVESEGGVVKLADIVTFYHPEGDATPAYRFVVDIVKVQNIIYNLDLVFSDSSWAGAPLIPDDQPTANRSARKPRHAKAAVASLIDNLGLEAIISDPDTAKASIVAEIDSANPRRLNLSFTTAISGNVGIISVDFNFGFYFGTPSLAA